MKNNWKYGLKGKFSIDNVPTPKIKENNSTTRLKSQSQFFLAYITNMKITKKIKMNIAINGSNPNSNV